MEVDGVAVARLQTVDAHRRAAPGFFREIAGLAPFQGLGEPADPPRLVGRIEHQLAQRHEFGADARRLGLESPLHPGSRKAPPPHDPYRYGEPCRPPRAPP